ncbi:MAG TPA: hypothetical protein VLB68_26630 [Pyrinomonadaceae bacterium]|nr:hypothetical protein [Pyrinomonadaceae bacterium]
MNQEAMQDSLVEGGGNGGSSTLGYATGATVPASGTYRCSNKYMDVIAIYAAGEKFLADARGQKTTWYPLTKTLSTNIDGGFTGTKVAPGTA